MPNAIYPIPKFLPNPNPARHGLKLTVWWRRDELDEQLARGAHPEARDDLALRSRQLLSRETRVQLAAGFESAVREARAPARVPTTVRLTLRRAAVRNCADDLLVLAQRLRSREPIDIRGAAMASMLLLRSTSPLYYEGATHTLSFSVKAARLALDPHGTLHAPVTAAA